MASIQHFLPKLEKSPDAIMEYWLTETEQQSKLLQAVLDPHNFKILYANDQFCYWSGIAEEGGDFRDQDFCLFDLFADFEVETQQALYRRHIFPLILRDIYGIEPPQWRLSDEPHVVTFYNEVTEEKHYIQFWLRSEHLRVERIDPELDEFGEMDWENQVSLPSQLLEERIQWSNYRVRGQLLWEGFEITSQETIKRLMDLLISCESMFEQEAFCDFGDQMRSLFHAETLAILSLQQGQVQFLICNRKQLDTYHFSRLDEFPCSHFLRAAEGNRVWNVPNLEQDHPTVLEEYLLNKGCCSLLLIPLRLPLSDMEEGQAGQLLGVVAMGSQRPNNFEQIDACHAEELIPALRMALRQATGEKLARVHPAVEWRFRQEAERRSLGMASEPIVFTQVYPLYGMSDIRGSSQERNRAVQEDLVTQFRLALELVESALEFKAIAFLVQLKLDLLAYLERIQGGIQVEDETTALQYLRQHIEVYFDYFRQCGEKAERQVREYLDACGNEHLCIYTSRDRYDQQINQLNRHLRETWEKWQSRMQDIFPHYCDLQMSDGIDHMIYVGSSIHEGFSPFHLHSLRYEQLRALCDCGRVCFELRDRYGSDFEVSHLILIQGDTVDIFHDEHTERLFDVMGTRDTRYEIVKKRIDKGFDSKDGTRITQPGMLTLVYATDGEWSEYHQYLRYLVREGWVSPKIESGTVEALPGLTGLKFARVQILPAPQDSPTLAPEEDLEELNEDEEEIPPVLLVTSGEEIPEEQEEEQSEEF